jgi:segregation and condensation protein A
MTVCVTLYALLELYKRGEADWRQDECFGDVTVGPSSVPGVVRPTGAAAA